MPPLAATAAARLARALVAGRAPAASSPVPRWGAGSSIRPSLAHQRRGLAASAAGGDGGAPPPPPPPPLVPTTAGGGRIVDTELRVEAEKSYLAYAMSVIVGRALPDVRDGLKPVHRRILFAMSGLGLAPTTPYRKCARVVGEVLGKYHPHGDTAVYDALVRLAQDFSMRAPLIAGHGNFGSLDADPPAAMRYTECRLQAISADALLRDLGADTVDMSPTFDGSGEEPTVLPARVPLLLVNGAAGIAVSIATRIPPHNLGETVAALKALVEDPGATTADLMRHLPAPDFPTGGEILDVAGVREAYETGRGPVTVRGKVAIEFDGDKAAGGGAKKGRGRKGKEAGAAAEAATTTTVEATSTFDDLDALTSTSSGTGRARIVISELPYQTNKAAFVARVAELVDAGVLTGVSDVRDESDRAGMRVVVEVRRGATPKVVLNALFRHTSLQARFSVNLVALVKGTPRTLPLRDCLAHFIEFRTGVIERRARFELGRAEARAHIVAGLLLAQADLDAVVKTVRAAPDGPAAALALQANHGLSADQADAVLAMALRRLTGLESGKLQAEAADLAARSADLKDLLASPARVRATIVSEAEEVAAKHGTPRRSVVRAGGAGLVSDMELVPDGESVIVYSTRGFIKRMAADTFAAQARGGRGKAGAGLRGAEDGVGDVLAARNHDALLFFTRDGGVRSVRVHEVPEASRSAAGTAITKLISVPRGGDVAALLAVRDFGVKAGVATATATEEEEEEEEEEIEEEADGEGGGSDDGVLAAPALPSSSSASPSAHPPQPDLLLLTRNGLVKRTALSQFARVRANGTYGIKLREGTGDELVWVARCPAPGSRVLVASSDGQVLIFAADSLRPSSRASTGVAAMRLAPGACLVGMVVLPPADADAAAAVAGDPGGGAAVLLVTKQGLAKKIRAADLRTMRRAGQGVRGVRLVPGDALAAVLPVPARSDAGRDLLVGTAAGVMLRTPQSAVATYSRSAKGVRLVRLDEGDAVQTVTVLSAEEAEAEEAVGGGGGVGVEGGVEGGVGGAPAAASAAPKAAAAAPAAAPKKPASAYMRFCADERPAVKAALPPKAGMPAISRELGRRWSLLSEAEKEGWKA